MEGFFNFGERWRQQRRTATLLKAEGLRFLELRPPYRRFETHAAAFPQFIDRLERVNEAESEAYLSLFAREPDEKGGGAGRMMDWSRTIHGSGDL